MKKLIYFVIFWSLAAGATNICIASRYDNPRMAIVISKTSYRLGSGVRNNAMAWGAVAHLAGIPYDCLFLSDLSDTSNLSDYDLMVLAQCLYVEEALYVQVTSTINRFLSQKGNHLIVDGPFALFNENSKKRNQNMYENMLGVVYAGFYGDSDFRIRVEENTHYITRPYSAGQFLTQHLTDGLFVQSFKDQNQQVLVLTDEQKTYPFLSFRENADNRIVLVSDFSMTSGIASFFRNSQPQVFYENHMYDILTRTVQWALYGDIQTPFPAPQLSNADLTAIIRLDADGSSSLEAQKRTIEYLTNLAKETGVLAVYAFVSDWAARAGWSSIAPLAARLEEFGGQIGTHSKTHRITQNKKWEEELGGSIRDIEKNIRKYGYDIGKVKHFINPGNSIPMEYYGNIADYFNFFMTHGGEQAIPLGYGNLTWFTGNHENFVALNNTPAPDYQWFYDETWNYSTAQITAYEEAIFDHMYRNVGRGVLFNEMWHDYAITAIHDVEPPRTQALRESGERIINTSNIALYDAMKSKFKSNNIYCPGPEDLANKMRLMAQWTYQWETNGDELAMTIDLGNLEISDIHNYTGGMGIRIENTNKYIQSVVINEMSHFAFSDRLIILPNLRKSENSIRVKLGPLPVDISRLLYISKRMPSMEMAGSQLKTSILTKSKARFSYLVKTPFVLLNADWQEWNRMGENILKGYVTTDRKMVLAEHSENEFYITRATLPISDFNLSNSQITLFLKSRASGQSEIWFQTEKPPKRATFGIISTQIEKDNQQYKITIPSFENTQELLIEF